jgi:glutaredoxin
MKLFHFRFGLTFLLGVFVLHSSILSQDIELLEERTMHGVELYAQNNTSDDLDITITATLTGFTTPDKNPANLILKKNSKQKVFTFNAPMGVSCEYQTSVSYKKLRKLTPASQASQSRTTAIQMNTNKINVFTQDGCGRCEYVVKYLTDMNIPFVELNTTIHDPNQALMFQKLGEAGFEGNSVQMPVVWNKGKLEYNINDLPKWVKTLK